jgi:hypothetical protein
MCSLPRVAPLLLLVLGAVLLGPPARGDEASERAARVAAARAKLAAEEAAFNERVNSAIDRGGKWLAGRQRNDGSYPGFSEDLKPRQYNIMEVGLDALVVLTLAHCGFDPKHDAVRKCLDFCRFHYSGGDGSLNLKGSGKLTTYTAATLILALHALYASVEERKGEVKKDRYGNPIPPKSMKCTYPNSIRHWMEELVKFVVEAQVLPAGGWRYPGNPLDAPEGDTDLSNTQYALLALDAAARCGIAVPEETWRKAAAYVLAMQEKDGLDAPVWVQNETWEPGEAEPPRFVEAAKARARGWGYLPGENELITGSMTAAGVTCLALVKERLWAMGKLDAGLRRDIDRGLLDGLAWLSENFTVTENPTPGGASMWHYYYLYGLERAGVKTGSRFIGQHDWYREGAEHLLGAQLDTGGWKEADGTVRPADATESAITQTCFAILFLKRSTSKPFVPVMPPVTGGGSEPVDGR